MAGIERSEPRASTEPIKGDHSAASGAESHGQESGDSGSSLEGVRVLVADDSAASQSQLVEMLSNWRMRPVAADSVESALSALDQQPFAVAIVDTKVSGNRGLELVESIRRRSPASGPA